MYIERPRRFFGILLGLMSIKEIPGGQEEGAQEERAQEGAHPQLQSIKKPLEQQIAMPQPLQVQHPMHPKRSSREERFVLYVRRISSLPSVTLSELYRFFRQFWLLWTCWAILFFVLINRIFTLLISAISRK